MPRPLHVKTRHVPHQLLMPSAALDVSRTPAPPKAVNRIVLPLRDIRTAPPLPLGKCRASVICLGEVRSVAPYSPVGCNCGPAEPTATSRPVCRSRGCRTRVRRPREPAGGHGRHAQNKCTSDSACCLWVFVAAGRKSPPQSRENR